MILVWDSVIHTYTLLAAALESRLTACSLWRNPHRLGIVGQVSELAAWVSVRVMALSQFARFSVIDGVLALWLEEKKGTC